MSESGSERGESGGATSLTALVRRPGADLSACELTHLEREPVDALRAAQQHAAYVTALRELGVQVTELEPLDGHPDALFVEDCALVLDEIAVLCRPGVASRRGEVASLEPHLALHRELVHIEEPGTLEGGDLVVIEGVVHVGWSGRTNHAGLKMLAHLLLEHGYLVKAAEVHGCLHLKSALSHLGDGRVLANRHWANLERVRASEVLEVDPSEPFGANVLKVGEILLCSASYPRTNQRLSAAGYELRVLELDELHKMEAAVTCPSLVFRKLQTLSP
ncbi:MAG: arginine deiminase-related protein [Planctomycetota bacterium]